MNQRLPFLDACDTCPVADVCRAAHTPDRCNDPVFYPVGGLHPVSNAVPQLQVPPTPRVRWARSPDHLQAISAATGNVAKGLHAAALTLRGTLRVLHGRTPLPANAVTAFMFGSDALLEDAWRDRDQFVQSLGVPLVAPAFSTWLETSPYEHIAQSIRGLVLAVQLAQHNEVVPSVPLSPWVEPAMWSRLLADASEIAVEMGTIDGSRWGTYVDLLAQIASEFDTVPSLLAYGVLSPRRLADVSGVWPARATFVSRGPVDYAMKGERLSYPELTPAKDWNEPREALIPLNDGAFAAVVDDVIRLPDRAEGRLVS